MIIATSRANENCDKITGDFWGGGELESLSEEVAFKLRSEGYEGPSWAQAEGLAGAEASGRKSVLRSRRKPA